MSQLPSKEDLPQRLADSFSTLIRDALTAEQTREVLSRNRTRVPGACATHSFCNAIALMTRAFVEVVGREPDTDDDVDLALWSAAWALAKNAGFPRHLELVTDPEGKLVYSIPIRETSIVDPRRSEDFFQSVDPELYYGLRPEELAAFDHANSMLQAEAAASGQEGPQSVITPTVHALPADHLHMKVWHTGADCHAVRIDCAGGAYILITEHGHAQVPPPSATEVDVGLYAANGNRVALESAIPVNRLLAWIAQARASTQEPVNVRDYFVLKLGASPLDDTLADLPITSKCGCDCVKAIDAAANLAAHLKAALGATLVEDHLVELARRIVGVYWRG